MCDQFTGVNSVGWLGVDSTNLFYLINVKNV
jgi:hypothetical protein